MNTQGGIRQPFLGIFAFIIIMFFSLGFIMWFSLDMFMGWVGYFTMTCIPISMIIAMVWQGNYPPPAATLAQPLKGLYLFLVILLIGAMVSPWSHKIIGGFLDPPTPFVVFFTMLSVTTTLWLVVVWQCWPVKALSSHPAFVGFGTLLLAYLLVIVQYKTLLDFSFLKDAPFYQDALDPHGAFPAWVSLSYILTTVAVILALVELDFWPFTRIAAQKPKLGEQPLWGLMVTTGVLVFAFLIWSVFVSGLGMDPVVYSIRIPICVIFGEFIMLLVFQTAPFQKTRQPMKGFALLLLSFALAVVMYYFYAWLGGLIHGDLPEGAPGYVLEMWIATALLSVTFPVITIYTGFLNYWPLTEPHPEKKEKAPEA